MGKKFKSVLSVRIFGESKCFGPGVAQLLKQVDEKHSLRAAAISMQMAYSKAWTIIKTAEKEFGFELLVTTTGGKHGGGASLSEKARAILAAYEDYRRELQIYADAAFEKTLGKLLNGE